MPEIFLHQELFDYFMKGFLMKLFELDFYINNIRILGIIAIIIGMGAWVTEWMGWVYICPFCRAQRTIIAILGLFMFLPHAKHFLVKYSTSILGFYGLFVASSQHFRGWVAIQRGDRNFLTENWWIDSLILSFLAICIIVAQVWLIFLNKKRQ